MDANDTFYMNFTFNDALTVNLPTPLQLRDYEVAVRFASLPYNFYNIPSTSVEVRIQDVKHRIVIPAGYYTGVQDLLDTVIRKIGPEQGIQLSYFPNQRIVHVDLADPRMSIRFSPILSAVLRLPQGTIKTHAESSSPVLFSGASQVFYVTTSFTEPQLYNGRLAPILAAISIGSVQALTDMENAYVPVKPAVYQQIGINILTANLQPVQFLSGSITIVVHFRRRS